MEAIKLAVEARILNENGHNEYRKRGRFAGLNIRGFSHMKVFAKILLWYLGQWCSYTWAHLDTGPGINLFGPGIKN